MNAFLAIILGAAGHSHEWFHDAAKLNTVQFFARCSLPLDAGYLTAELLF